MPYSIRRMGHKLKQMGKMENKRWLQEFDATKHTFKWFFIEYGFDDEWKWLEECRAKNQVGKMKVIMNNVWFELPDDKFNVKVMPNGWENFLSLIED